MTPIKVFSVCVFFFITAYTALSRGAAWRPGLPLFSSLVSLQDMLAAPPMPVLAPPGRTVFSVQGGLIQATIDDDTSSPTTGKLSGQSFGFGAGGLFNSRLGYFFLFSAYQAGGSIEAPGSAVYMKDISTQGLMTTAGLSYLFFGDSKSGPSLSGFLGPAYMSSTTKYVYTQDSLTVPPSGPVTGPAVSANYEASPTFTGALAGLQLKYNFGDFEISPYVLYFYETSSLCKKLTSAGSGLNNMCDTEPSASNSLSMKGTFGSLGLDLGYGPVRINLFAKSSRDSTLEDIQTQSFQLMIIFTGG